MTISRLSADEVAVALHTAGYSIEAIEYTNHKRSVEASVKKNGEMQIFEAWTEDITVDELAAEAERKFRPGYVVQIGLVPMSMVLA